MMGMVQEKRFQAEREAARMEADALLRATLGEMKGAFHELLKAKAEAHPDVHNHIYQDGRSVNVDGRSVNVDGRSVNAQVNVDARSMDARTVNLHNEQKLLRQQLNAAFNMQHNSGSSSGLKRPGDPEDEVFANSSKRPPPVPPGAGAIRIQNRPQQFSIGDDPAVQPPPLPPPDDPPMSHLHRVGAIMLEKERIEREQAGIFASAGKKEKREEREEKGARSRSASRKRVERAKSTPRVKPTKNSS